MVAGLPQSLDMDTKVCGPNPARKYKCFLSWGCIGNGPEVPNILNWNAKPVQ